MKKLKEEILLIKWREKDNILSDIVQEAKERNLQAKVENIIEKSKQMKTL